MTFVKKVLRRSLGTNNNLYLFRPRFVVVKNSQLEATSAIKLYTSSSRTYRQFHKLTDQLIQIKRNEKKRKEIRETRG